MTKTKKIILIVFVLFALVLVSPAVLGEGQQGDGEDDGLPLPTFAPNAWDWNADFPPADVQLSSVSPDVLGMNSTITVRFEAYYFDETGNRIYVRASDGGYERGRAIYVTLPSSSRITLHAPYGIPSDEVYYKIDIFTTFGMGTYDSSFIDDFEYCIDADISLPQNIPFNSVSDVRSEMRFRYLEYNPVLEDDVSFLSSDTWLSVFPSTDLKSRTSHEFSGGRYYTFDYASLEILFTSNGNIFSKTPSFSGSFYDYISVGKKTDESILSSLFTFDSQDLVDWLLPRADSGNACTEVLLGTFSRMRDEYINDNSDTLFSFNGFNLKIGGTDYGTIIPSFSVSSGFDVVTVNGNEIYVLEISNILKTVRRFITYIFAFIFLYTYVRMYLRLFGVKSERVVNGG